MGVYTETAIKEDMKNRKHEDEKKEKAEVGLVAARENFEASAALLPKWSNYSQLLTQTGQIGAYILRSAFSVGYSKAHPADSDCANRSVNFTLRFSGHWRQLFLC